MSRHRILMISILGTPGAVRADLFAGMPEGENDLQWLQRRLTQASIAEHFELDYADITLGDALPAIEAYDAVVIGGSIHNANEGQPWQLALFDWLSKWRSTRRPLFGICGGHQHATLALGGEVQVMGTGPHAETAAITLSDAGREHFLFKGCGTRPTVHLGHNDHVTRIPAGATILATYGDTIQALDMGGDWLTVQFHPEASATLMVRGWDNALPNLEQRYRPAGTGRQIIANFFHGTGLVDALAPNEP